MLKLYRTLKFARTPGMLISSSFQFRALSFAPALKQKQVQGHEPQLDLRETHPKPVRKEFMTGRPITPPELENMDIRLSYHFEPQTISDKIAYRLVKMLRFPTDVFFKKKYVHRAVMLETVAGVPGFVAGMLRHLTSLRTARHDGGWIHHLLHEAGKCYMNHPQYS